MPRATLSGVAEGTTRTRKDGLAESRLLVPKEYRAAVGKTYLYFYGKTEREAKKRAVAYRELMKNGPRAFEASKVTLSQWLERWLAPSPARLRRTPQASTSTTPAPT